jgi:outer membrane biogenesis lipoprotein LolB
VSADLLLILLLVALALLPACTSSGGRPNVNPRPTGRRPPPPPAPPPKKRIAP